MEPLPEQIGPQPQSEAPMKRAGLDHDKVVSCVVEKWGNLTKTIRHKYFFMQECQLAWERRWGATWDEISDGRSHRYIPKAFQTVETAVSQYLQSIIPNPRCFDVVGRTKTDDQNAFSAKAKLLWDHYRTNFRNDIKQFVKAAAVHGNVPWTVVWKTERAVFPDEEGFKLKQMLEQYGMEVEVNDESGLGYPTTEKVTFEGAKLIVGDIFNYVQERHPDDPKYAFRVYRTNETLEYIKHKWGGLKDENGQPIYRNLDRLVTGSYQYETSDSVKRAIDASIGYVTLPEDKIELLTFCGDLQIEGVGYFHNVFGVIANRQHLLRFTANPFSHGLPPWQMFSLIPNSYDPHGFGTGLIEPNLGLYDMVNVRMNQVADANALAISPPLAVVKDGITDYHQIVWGPMEQITMREAGNVAPMQVPKGALQLGTQEVNYYTQEIANTSGSLSQGGGNASEVQGIQAQVGALANEHIRHIQSDGLIKILKMSLALNQQCMSPDNPILLRLEVDESGQAIDQSTGQSYTPGKHWAEVSASDIQGDFDFEIIGSDAINQSNQEFQAQMQFMNAANQDPEFQAYVKKSAWYMECMKKLKFGNAWNFIKTDQEVQFEQQQQQQEAMAQQQQQQAMGQSGTPQQAQAGGSPPRRTGVPSTPGNAGGGGSPPHSPFREQLVGPTGNAGR